MTNTEGLMLIGSVHNITGTLSDLFVIPFAGNVAGFMIAVDEVFLIPDYFYLPFLNGQVSKYCFLQAAC